MTSEMTTDSRGKGLHPDVRLVRIVMDASGVSPPPFASAPNPEATYRLRYGLPVAYSPNRLIAATREGVSTTPTGLCGNTDRQSEFARAMTAYFAGHGFRDAPDGLRWVHADHGPDFRFDELSVSSDGSFRTEAKNGGQKIKYEIVDHSAAQRILDGAADEKGMV